MIKGSLASVPLRAAIGGDIVCDYSGPRTEIVFSTSLDPFVSIPSLWLLKPFLLAVTGLQARLAQLQPGMRVMI